MPRTHWWKLLLIGLLIVGVACGEAASRKTWQRRGYMIPDYEVKLIMHPEKVMDGELLKKEVRDFFGMPENPIGYTLQFLDTNDQALNGKGWNVRLRRFAGQNEFQLTYKKRYSIIGSNIDASLAQAAFDGFDDTEKNFDAQVEWGLETKTLSLAFDKTVGTDLPGSALPNEKTSRAAAIKSAPAKFDDGFAPHWGTNQLSTARLYGPVKAKRYFGSWMGVKITIEIWYLAPARSDYPYSSVVEISFKTGSYQKAESFQKQLMGLLQTKGWFYPEGVLKTKLVLERY